MCVVVESVSRVFGPSREGSEREERDYIKRRDSRSKTVSTSREDARRMAEERSCQFPAEEIVHTRAREIRYRDRRG